MPYNHLYTLPLHKMITAYAKPVEYHWSFRETRIRLNALLGEKISLSFTGEIRCIQCGRKTAKSFQQGFCFPCYRRLSECGLCIIHPEKCRYYEGVCSTDDWAHAHCGVPHVIYLANTSGLKVGITRASQIPTRWIDQGATQGMVIMRCQNRRQAGLVEVALKAYVKDKTNWRSMLRGDAESLDLLRSQCEISRMAQEALQPQLEAFPQEVEPLAVMNPVNIEYPVLHYPDKIVSLDLTKTPKIEGSLLGIKGQYLILDTGVISIRKFAGYAVQIGFNVETAVDEFAALL